MSGHTRDTQVVFLVDISTCRQTGTKWDESISLFIFRILSFLNTTLGTTDPKQKAKKFLKWGYKLLDIDEQTVKTDSLSSSFKDFKLKYFEEFERNLKNVVLGQRTDLNTSTCSSSKQRSQQGQGSRRRSTVSSYPARSLSRCLTETLHDFQWEMPDIGSPVKRKKGPSQSGSKTNSNFKSNYVFLISRVPCNRTTLRHFSNKVVMDKDVFIESFMSQMLQREYCDERKIHLYWVDTGPYWAPGDTYDNVPADKKSLEIVEQSLKSLGGALVPFHALVTHLSTNHHRHFAQVTASNGDGSTTTAAGGSPAKWPGREEVGVLLSSFPCMSACAALVWGGAPANTLPPAQHAPQSTASTLIISLKDGGKPVEVVLRLVGVVQPFSNRGVRAAELAELRLDADDCCCLLRQSGRAPHTLSATHWEVRACIHKAQLRRLGANLGAHFVVGVSDNVSVEIHQAFSSLLGATHSQQQALVLSVKWGSEPCPHLVVLEAVSPTCAHLSYLSLHLTLQVEKVISLQGHKGAASTSQDSDVGRSAILLQDFKDRAARAIANGAKPPQARLKESGSPAMWMGVFNPWHVSGSVSRLQSALDKVTDRLDDLSYLTEEEKSALVEVQQAYRAENHTPLLLQPSQHSTPLLPASSSLLPSLSRTGSSDCSRDDGSAGDTRLRPESSLLARGRLMVSKARRCSSLTQDEVDGQGATPTTDPPHTHPKLDVSHVDVKSKDDLSLFLQDQYHSAVQSGVGLESAVQSMVTVTQHFMATQQGSHCPQKGVDFLRDKCVKSCQELKAAYQASPARGNSKVKVTEYKLQVLLRLEMECVCGSVDSSQQEQSADQVVELLRSLLFVTETGELVKFLNTTLLSNYVATLPQLLVTIYDELMQPLPPALADFGSPTKVPSMPQDPLSVGDLRSVGPDSALSAPPGSNQSSNSQTMRTRSSLRSHPSLTGLSNKRQIVVQAKVPPKAKSDAKIRTKAERKSPRKRPKEKVASEVKKARRNLFNTKTGQRSLAKRDTDKHKTTPKKKAKETSPSKKSKSSKTMVAETPRHRQRSGLSWKREQVMKQLSQSGPPDVQVILESPIKQIADLKCSPGRYKPARRVLRQSFYSAGQHSRNLARALDLSNRIGGRHHRHQHLSAWAGGRLCDAVRSKEDDGLAGEALQSPRRQAAAFLRRQLMRSPSPSPSPARSTRARTPHRSPRPRPHHDASSLPAWSSVVSRLDFTSPVKRPSPSASSVLARSTPPTGEKRRAVLVADTPTKEEGGGTVTPRKSRGRNTGQVTPLKAMSGASVIVTPVKGATGHVTPVKVRPGTSGQCKAMERAAAQVTPPPLEEGSSSKLRAQKARGPPSQRTPSKQGPRSTPMSRGQPARPHAKSDGHGGTTPKKRAETSRKGAVTPKRRERGGRGELKGVSPAQSSSSSSSSSQSSILDYVSPTRRPRAPSQTTAGPSPSSGPGLSSPPPSSRRNFSAGLSMPLSSFTSFTAVSYSHSGAGNIDQAGRSSSTYQGVPFGGRHQAGASGERTPSKTRPDLLSPSKMQTRPILKTSPLLQRSASGPSCTPQKSPRVTFERKPGFKHGSRTPSPAREGQVGAGTPDSMDKWRRRKRRWTGDKSSSPSADTQLAKSGPAAGKSAQRQRDDVDVSASHLVAVVKGAGDQGSTDNNRPVLKTKDGSVSHLPPVEAGLEDSCDALFPLASRKRAAAFSETSVSSSSKKRRAGKSAASSVSQPVSFSENAMDSYFSASNDDVFLASSSSRLSANSSTHSSTAQHGSPQFKVQPGRQGSPQFKVQAVRQGSAQLRSQWGDSRGLKRCKSSFVSEGSQGFDVSSSKDSGPPASPAFTSVAVATATSEDSWQGRFAKVRSLDGGQADHGNTARRKRKREMSRSEKDPESLGLQTEESEGSQGDGEAEGTVSAWESGITPTAGRDIAREGTSALLTPTRVARSNVSPVLTPLRVKGTATDRKFSPTVSTTSLVQLMSSPLLQGAKSRGRLFREADLDTDQEISPTRPPKVRKTASKMQQL